MKLLTLGMLGLSVACAAADLSYRTRPVVEADGRWEMAQATAPDAWMPAKVPGTVLGTLVANRKVPDPFWGTNNRWEDRLIPDVGANRDFYTATYRTKVEIPADFKDRVVWMRPEGVNYRSEIYLNGRLVTSTRGMFARNAVDVSEFVQPGAANDLLVKVWPVDHPGSPRPKRWGAANGEWRNGGDGEIGRNVTMLMSAGWDFTFSDGIRDRNTGIVGPVTFFATGKARLDAPYVRTKLNADQTEADLTLEIDVHNAAFAWGLATLKGTVTAEVEGTDVRFAEDVELYRGERRTLMLKAKMPRPRLWWPANKGAQPLYVLKAKFTDAKGAVSDEVKVRFGVREFTSDQSGKDGARQFYVNRRKIFIRGTNWIPDAMLACDDARMETIMRLVAESGFNLVRLWGGGIVESDRFYELCDEYGLMVWQEFWMTGDTRHPDDPGLYLDNVAQALKRIRSHACMSHYVASNESTETSGTEELVKRLTGTTSWMQQSECDGVHDGSPYVSVNPMRHYEDTASDRGSRLSGFNPEYGAIGIPCVENLRTFLPEEALWPVEKNAKTWNYREGGGFNGMTKTHHTLVKAYGAADSIDVYCRRSEAADYLQQLAIWECWNRARTAVDATGVLYWYENPPIPELAVHGWDYQLAQTPMFFATRRANAPLHAAYEYLSNTVFVTSDVYGAHKLTVRARVFDFDSKQVWEKSAEVDVPGETAVDAFRIPVDDFKFTKPHFIVLDLLEGGRKIDSNFYWRSCDVYKGAKTMTGPCTAGFEALADLPRTKLNCVATPDGLEVRNVGDKIAFMMRIKGSDGDGNYVGAVHYSDNFFSLLPGEARTVKTEGPNGVSRIGYLVSAWNADAVDVRPMSGAVALERLPWIGDGRPVFANDADFYGEDPAPEFRAVCTLPEEEGDVVVTIACAGYCQVRFNGKRPKNEPALMPLWSPFDHTVYSERLVFGADARRRGPRANVVSVTLGNGFYNLPPLLFWGHRCFRKELAHGRPCFKLTVKGVEKPLTWMWRKTRIVRNCVYLGEEFDWAREEDRAWKPAAEVEGPKGRIVRREAPPTRLGLAVPGRARWLKEGEVQVVDFGVNATGIPRFMFAGQKKGQRIEIVYGERLNPDGSVNVLTQTAGQIKKAGRGGPGAPAVACQRDVYVYGTRDCKGSYHGAEVFAPRFTWHVCRYAEVRGYDRLLEGAGAAEMQWLAPAVQDMPRAAKFRAARPEYDRIHEICRRTFLANAIGGVQSDCPGRERLGYGGDIVATCEAYMLNWDMREFYLKTLRDFADEAEGDGWLTETAPYVGIAVDGFGGRSGPISWTVAVPVLMDGLIRHYPDVKDRALAFYPVCARYARMVAAKCPDGIVPRCIGDHEALERAPNAVTATAHWHQFAALTAKFAGMLGKDAEAEEFAAIAAKAKAAFAAKYVKDGVVANGTQSAQAIALYLGLVPEEQVPAAEKALVAAVEAKGCAPYTGIFSTRYMLMYLSEHGRRDLAEKIVLHRGFPGWLHMIDRGATTLWETWKESDNVYSNCHPMFGSVDEWILRFGGK